MSQSELLRRVVEACGAAGVDYMVTGSVASSLYGEPRSTHDIDLVVALHREQVGGLLRAFPQDAYYLSVDAIQDAIRSGSMFNLIALSEGDKVDFWMLTETAFDQSRFHRRVFQEFAGLRMAVASPEDTILAKLDWAQRSGGSEKQFTDALRVFEVQSAVLDRGYLETWAKKLGVETLWARLLSEAQPI